MEDFVSTRGARAKASVREDFVSIEYIARKKKKATDSVALSRKPSEDNRDEDGVDPKKQQELEMKRARYDVIKFGMSGFGNVEANRAKVAAAIALGARPPKNEKVPYKKLKEDRRRAKEKIAKQERVSGATKSLAKLRGGRKNRDNKKRESGILGVYGKVERTGTSKRRKSCVQ